MKAKISYVIMLIILLTVSIIAWINNYVLSSLFVISSTAFVLYLIYKVWIANYIYRRNTFIIKKGKHRSRFTPYFLWNTKIIEGRLSFSDSCWYNDNDEHINKLVGLYWNGIHDTSIRIGWNTSDKVEGRIRLFFYCYVHGKRVVESWGKLEPKMIMLPIKHKTKNIEYRFQMGYDNSGKFLFIKICDKHWNEINRFQYVQELKLSKFGGLCFPYFGGKEKAPHNMNVEVQIFNKF